MKPYQQKAFQKNRPKATICYNCGKSGHIVSQCQEDEQSRMDICWTCGSREHIRTSRACPGNQKPENWFCSFCRTKGVTTRSCTCNEVGTTKHQPKKPTKRKLPNQFEKEVHEIEAVLTKKRKSEETQSGTEAKPKPDRSRIVVKVNTQRRNNLTSERIWAVKVGINGNNFMAQIAPGGRSFINPERVHVERTTNVPTRIYNRTRNICYNLDTTIATPVVLGEDAISIFGLEAFVGGEQVLPYSPDKKRKSDTENESDGNSSTKKKTLPQPKTRL